MNPMNVAVAGVFVPIVLFIGLFSFLAVAAWTGTRAKEREAYYKTDLLKKIAESTEAGGKAALQYLREQHRLAQERRRGGLILGGLVTAATGVGLMISLGVVVHRVPVYYFGLIPLLIGVTIFVYARFMMPGPVWEETSSVIEPLHHV